MSLKCVKDCWKCELEGCPYSLWNGGKIEKEASEKPPQTSRQLTVKKYNNSYKAKLVKQRYNNSEKGKKTRKECYKRYKENNHERLKEIAREKYKLNPERQKASSIRWRQNNLYKSRKSSARYSWKKYFEKKNGRSPSDEEIKIWEAIYDLKKKTG